MSELTARATRPIVLYTTGDGKCYATRFYHFTDQQVLENAGKVSQEMAHAGYEKFRVHQDLDYRSDFDLKLAHYLKGEGQP